MENLDYLDEIIKRNVEGQRSILRSVFSRPGDRENNFPDSSICTNCDGQGEVEIEGMFFECKEQHGND